MAPPLSAGHMIMSFLLHKDSIPAFKSCADSFLFYVKLSRSFITSKDIYVVSKDIYVVSKDIYVGGLVPRRVKEGSIHHSRMGNGGCLSSQLSSGIAQNVPFNIDFSSLFLNVYKGLEFINVPGWNKLQSFIEGDQFLIRQLFSAEIDDPTGI